MIKILKKFFELVKFEHTVFALPFAYLGMLLAQKAWPGWRVFFWVTLAMVCARTAGMTLNRIIDLGIDAKNPRTRNRPLVTGDFSMLWAWLVAAIALFFFFISAYELNPLCFKLAPAAIVLLSGYHYVKRFSILCHWSLGLVLAVAPMGGWIAVSGVFAWQPLLLAAAVLFWVAGFDILYSLQDMEFDRASGLFSVPARMGVSGALKISEYCHWAAVFFLMIFGIVMALGVLYWIGFLLVAALLKLEHHLVGDGDLSGINTAFFSINGWVGVLLLVFTFLDIY